MKSQLLIKYILGICVLFGTCLPIYSYTNKPVLVHVNVLKQSDTFGFNLVKEMNEAVYKLIEKGKITLWDSYKKNIRINFENLKSVEKSTKTRFERSYDLFLHEFWSSNRRTTEFTIVGITFMNQINPNAKPDREKDPIYGYIDILESATELANIQLDCNVNGPATLNLFQALYSRKYVFNLVQFGSLDFKKEKDFQKSFKIKNKAFYSSRQIKGLYSPRNEKRVQYRIDASNDDNKDMGFVLFRNLQNYFNSNREEVYNLGGGKYFDYLNYKSDFVVTGIQVNELWEKLSVGFSSRVRYITIYVNNNALDPIPLETISNWGILFNFKVIDDVLNEKKYNYTIEKINNLYIMEFEAPKYLKALQLGYIPWSQISKYVAN